MNFDNRAIVRGKRPGQSCDSLVLRISTAALSAGCVGSAFSSVSVGSILLSLSARKLYVLAMWGGGSGNGLIIRQRSTHVLKKNKK